MKLAKLSLAAVVAVCGLTTVSSAVDLQEAIKGTSLNGYVRYRHNVNYNGDDRTLSTNEYKGVFNFKMPVNDMVKANIKFVTVGTTSDATGDANPTLNTKLANFIITPTKAIKVTVGKQGLVTPFADPADQAGTGVVAMMNLEKIKLFGGAYSNTQLTKVILPDAESVPTSTSIVNADIYAAGVSADLDIVKGEFWYALVEPKQNENNAAAMYVEANLGLIDLANKKGKMIDVQIAHATLDLEDLGGVLNEQTRVVASLNIDAIKATFGYVMTGEDGGNVTLGDTDAKANFGLEHLEAANVADATLMYIAGGMKIGEALDGKVEVITGEAGDTDLQEVKLSAGYNMSKNFRLSGWYSMGEIGDADLNKARFEAKYKF